MVYFVGDVVQVVQDYTLANGINLKGSYGVVRKSHQHIGIYQVEIFNSKDVIHTPLIKNNRLKLISRKRVQKASCFTSG